MGQNVQTYYSITIKHVWEHGKYWASKCFQGLGNWEESLNWKHDAESTFLSHDLGQIAKNIFNKRKAKNTVKPSGQKAVGFRHFAKREFETNEICSHALKPNKHIQISTQTVSIKSPTHPQNDLQESQSVYFRVKLTHSTLRAKKCRKELSSSWKLKHHHFWARAQEMPKMSLVICRWIQTFKWVLHGSRKGKFRPT